MFESIVCELLGTRYPLIQGGMAWIADADLASSVSNVGALGVIAAGYAPGEWVREEIRSKYYAVKSKCRRNCTNSH